MEIYEKEPVSLYLSELDLLEDITSNVQHVQLFQHPNLGKVLVINDEIQHVENWWPLYHEAIVHIPMMFIQRPRSVLILGGGDLYAAELVLRYPSIEKVVLCDYDPEVVRLTQKYYPHGKSTINDSRLHIIFENAKDFLQTCYDQFDLVIDDCFNLVTDFPPETDIFQRLYDLLQPDIGVCSSLMYRHIFDEPTLFKTKSLLFQKHKTVLSLVAVPEYPGFMHLLTMWGKASQLSQDMHHSRNETHLCVNWKKLLCSQFFDPNFCDYYLYLPPYIKKILN